MITIMNLSGLAEVLEDNSIPANMAKYVSPNLARQWASIRAFAELHATYAPFASSRVCGGFFSMPIDSYAWVLGHIDWRLISQYKMGDITSLGFLRQLLEVFPFLTETNFTLEIKEELFKNKDRYISIRDLSQISELTQEHTALALLERAFLARMQFSQEEQSKAKVRYFFEESRGQNKQGPRYFIANSSEMDCLTTINYLRSVFPDLAWKSTSELNLALQVPQAALAEGISLTTDGSLQLYVSYAHRASKTGQAEEVNMTTDNLLKKLVEQEKIDVNNARLVSQWPGDCTMARTLGFKDVLNAKAYFAPIELNNQETKLKVA